MIHLLLLGSLVIIACILCNRVSNRFGFPMLLTFILLGMVFCSEGLVRIHFDNFSFAENVCTVALIFIMFYGGFGTRWKSANPAAVKAAFLSVQDCCSMASVTGHRLVPYPDRTSAGYCTFTDTISRAKEPADSGMLPSRAACLRGLPNM